MDTAYQLLVSCRAHADSRVLALKALSSFVEQGVPGGDSIHLSKLGQK